MGGLCDPLDHLCTQTGSKMAPLVHAARGLKGTMPKGPEPAAPPSTTPPPSATTDEAVAEAAAADEASAHAVDLVRLGVRACTATCVATGLVVR